MIAMVASVQICRAETTLKTWWIGKVQDYDLLTTDYCSPGELLGALRMNHLPWAYLKKKSIDVKLPKNIALDGIGQKILYH